MTLPSDRVFQALKAKPLETSDNLETFDTPYGVTYVRMESDEVTSLCPITGQPDFETITIEYGPRRLCIESKSLKLYFQSLRDVGEFIEDLSSKIADLVVEAIQPEWVVVSAKQRPRGGIEILARTRLVIKEVEEGFSYIPLMEYPS